MSEARNLLSTGPYGSSAGIGADMAAFTGIAAELLHANTGLRLPEPPGDATLIGRSVERVTTLNAFRALRARDTDEASRLLRRGAHLLSGLGAGTEAPVPGHAYALAGDWSGTEAGAGLRAAISTDLERPHAYVAATAEHVAAVGSALRLIEEAVGDLAGSVLDSVSGAVLIEDSIIESAFIVPAPFVSVLNTSVFGSVLKTADAVFHEAAHQKFYDLLVCRRLVDPGYNYLSGAVFGIPWNLVDGKRRTMDCLRILSTVHVYAHLLELLLSVRESGAADADECDGMLTEYWQRAVFFDTAVRSTVVRGALGPDARTMIDWIAAVMDTHRRTFEASGRGTDSPYRTDAVDQVRGFMPTAVAA